MSEEPVRAWTLPSRTVNDLPVMLAAVARALQRDASSPPNRAYRRCRRWHRPWRSDIYIANERPYLDCSRCGLRWVW